MSKRKLLLADDSVTVQKVVNLAFESEDIEVITADNGNSAFEKFVEFTPDLVMADINLPGANGYEICQRIKQDEETKHIPVILLVGSFVPFSEEKGEKVGADGFLKKPFQSIGLLINKVTELLDKSNEEAAETSPPTGLHEADTQPMPAFKPSEMAESESNYSMDEEFSDDEMIETERVGDYSLVDETSKYETNTGFDLTPEDSGKTQPMTYTDIEELDLSDQQKETSEETVYELADEPDDYPSAESYDFGEENAVVETDSYSEYSDYRQPVETEEFPAPQIASALSLDEFELLELPPLGKPPEISSFDQTDSDEIPDNSDFENVAEETLQANTDYSDYPEPTAEEADFMPGTVENNYALTGEPTAEFNSSEGQSETIDYKSETSESDYSSESETDEESAAFDEDEEISASYPEESTEEYSEEEESEAMIAEETNQEIVKANANELVVHYFPPEVIDAIAERVVEKLAEKLGR